MLLVANFFFVQSFVVAFLQLSPLYSLCFFSSRSVCVLTSSALDLTLFGAHNSITDVFFSFFFSILAATGSLARVA